KACLQNLKYFATAKDQKFVLEFDDFITKLCLSVKNSTELVKTLKKQYPVALIVYFHYSYSDQYEILDYLYNLNNISSHSHKFKN
ncbi:hypothetical protein, partial [Francisella tularensis]|uniref:hypothetical protein n=1 Tax=Francisella tularensis TaxID=263 RepID=UPI002381BADF